MIDFKTCYLEMNMVEILLCRATPYGDIDIVNNYTKFIACDQYHVRYQKEYPAYIKMREFFLEHTEYDYMVLASDDILVTPEHIEILKKTLNKKKYKIVSGLMNVDSPEWNKPNGRINITLDLPKKNMSERSWNFILRKEIPSSRYFKCGYSGFPLMAIHRDVVEKFVFDTTGVWDSRGVAGGYNIDLVFCWRCHEAGIPIWVDSKIDMFHLRGMGNKNIGIKPSNEEFIPYQNN